MSSTPFNPDRILVALLGLGLGVFGVSNLVKVYFEPARPTHALQSVGSQNTPPQPSIPNIELRHREPRQESPKDLGSFSYKGYQLVELAHFQADAVVLSKAHYSATSHEHRGVLAPVDLAIGWGPMSNPAVLQNFAYFQKNRFFYYATYKDFTSASDRLNTDSHVANIHLIPANADIASALEKIEPRDIIQLEGSLVEVKHKKQSVWKSSLSRTDAGDGACEILYLTRLAWTKQPPETSTIPLPEGPTSELYLKAPDRPSSSDLPTDKIGE